MHFCLGLASHAKVIDKGQIVYTSRIEELNANENIEQRYLVLSTLRQVWEDECRANAS
jgi:branched-chain amino acid transport system ATP-binding protein